MGRIRSGNFGGMLRRYQQEPSQNQNSKLDNCNLRVNRTYTPSSPHYVSNEPITTSFNLSYSIDNSKFLSRCYNKPPLIVIHGGPGIPSQYLRPISNQIKDRAIIYYDQIGCGKSSEPSDTNAYSIECAVDDLEHLIRHLGLDQFHLCGHSFGGIIAYEFVKRRLSRPYISADARSLRESSTSRAYKCLSLILSSTPFSIQQVDNDSIELKQSLSEELTKTKVDPDTSDEASTVTLFQKTFVCRTSDILPLHEAFSNRGTVWQGTDVIQDYVAEKPSHEQSERRNETTPNCQVPKILLMRGEFDFVSAEYAHDTWKRLFADVSSGTAVCETATLTKCSHYGMLEDGPLYCQILQSFLSNSDAEEIKCCDQ